MTIDLNHEFFQLEQKLALVGQKLSIADANKLIADEFVEFGVSGKVWRKPEIVSAITSWPVIERVVKNFSVTELSPSICLVTYVSRQNSNSEQGPTNSLRSSIWRRTNGIWQIIFHQGTRCSEDK